MLAACGMHKQAGDAGTRRCSICTQAPRQSMTHTSRRTKWQRIALTSIHNSATNTCIDCVTSASKHTIPNAPKTGQVSRFLKCNVHAVHDGCSVTFASRMQMCPSFFLLHIPTAGLNPGLSWGGVGNYTAFFMAPRLQDLNKYSCPCVG